MLRAVVADDEPAVRSIIAHLIERKGLPLSLVGQAEDGRQAVEQIRRLHPDLVFLDIQMPGLNGFEVMAACPGASYVVITAHESFQYAQQALRLGAKDLLLKPIEPGQLIRAIERAMGWNFTDSTLVNEAVQWLHIHFTEKVVVAELAKELHTTPSYLARMFKKYMGQSVLSYLHQLRIRRAAELLDSGEHAIKEIAERTGYENLNNFYQHFKAQMGKTPVQYLRKREEGTLAE